MFAYFHYVTNHPKLNGIECNHFTSLMILWVRNSGTAGSGDFSVPWGLTRSYAVAFSWLMGWSGLFGSVLLVRLAP